MTWDAGPKIGGIWDWRWPLKISGRLVPKTGGRWEVDTPTTPLSIFLFALSVQPSLLYSVCMDYLTSIFFMFFS